MTTPIELAPFRVDDAAFDDWIDMHSDTLESEIPTPGTHPGPAAALGALIEEAAAIGPLVGDRRVELQVIAADDEPGPGYVLIVRPRGCPQLPGVTSGWTDLTYPEAQDDPRDAVWRYLTTICEQANALLDDTRKVLP